MNQQEFENRVLTLWTTSLVPLTRANLLAYSQAPRAKMEAWLDQMVRSGLAELDSDDEGELLWRIRGSARPSRGTTAVGDLLKLERLKSEVGQAGAAISVARAVAGRSSLATTERKSVLASGALSLFFGPFGWLYAAPLREALPVIAGYVLLCTILPHMLLVYLLGPLNSACALLGLGYAWRYNQEGRRMPFLVRKPPRLTHREQRRL